MKKRTFLKTISTAGILSVVPAAVAKVRETPALEVSEPSRIGRDHFKAMYWSGCPKLTPEQADKGYFDYVRYHNDLVNKLLQVQSLKGSEHFAVCHARMITNHPDHFSDFSQGMVSVSEELYEAEGFEFLPREFQQVFRPYIQNQLLEVTNEELTEALTSPWFVKYET